MSFPRDCIPSLVSFKRFYSSYLISMAIYHKKINLWSHLWSLLCGWLALKRQTWDGGGSLFKPVSVQVIRGAAVVTETHTTVALPKYISGCFQASVDWPSTHDRDWSLWAAASVTIHLICPLIISSSHTEEQASLWCLGMFQRDVLLFREETEGFPTKLLLTALITPH